jgi:hypothetical protein
MTANIVKSINVNELSITKPVLNKRNKLQAIMLIDGETFSLRTGMLKAPFGLRAYGNSGEGADSYSLNVSEFPFDKDKKNIVNDFFDGLADMDNMLIQYALEHSEAIFGKGKKYVSGTHDAIVEALYTPTVKTGEDKEGNSYPRRLTAKVRGKYDEPEHPNVQVYLNSPEDINNESYTFENLTDLIPPGTFVDMICQPNIWFINGKFGISWKVLQVKVNVSSKKKLKNYAFSDDESDASENDNKESVDDDKCDSDDNSNVNVC